MADPFPSRRTRDVAILAPVIGTLLLLPPFVGLFARPDIMVYGVPLIAAYLTAVWLGMIATTLVIARKLSKQTGRSADRPDP